MGGGTTRSRQTTTTTLPANQQRNVDALLGGALDYFNTGGRSFFPGDIVADFDPLQSVGQNLLVNYAGGPGGDLVNRAVAANNVFLDPANIFNPSNIPGFSGMEEAITRSLTQNLTENILPRIGAEGTMSGQFGGSATGIGEGLAAGRTSDAIGDALAPLYLGAYAQGLNSFNQAQNRIPSLFGLGLQPGQITSAVGAERQNQAQNEIQGDVARFEFEQNEPVFMLELLRQLTGQAGTFGGTTTTNSKQSVDSSPVNQAIGGALALSSLWNPMTSIFGNMGRVTPAAAGAGAFTQ